ncbi:PQQ-dependent sugar dehydrogenase [Tessaracoccus sp. MC1679]|uniref:PQQ-dependent sugar dehydrogenase n=1 Tax=Tessaracoccus sp. MC1679 TaxID=2760313 RepID=UPI00160185F8|nr:PQQ-dependent sugar dehydrogenase [Tessaracoccus sp. MC1679]MBB1514698.1 PQQ-dependent sugar dehydrogenase [Tessaracoccus sp. MC1679]
MRRLAPAALALAGLAACSGPAETPPTTSAPSPDTSSAPAPTASATTPAAESTVPETHEFTVVEHERFDEPWALAFLPGTGTMAVTERGGTLKLRDPDGTVREVSGVPDVVAAGQGGLGDLIPGPTFADDGTVYLCWVERGDGGTGAVVGHARLDVEAATLSAVDTIWEQTPKVDGDGHFSHRLLIQDDHLFVSSGDRQKFDPAQAMDGNLGKIVRLTLDGDPAPENPWATDGGVAAEFWSIGHRNPLGLAVDDEGRLWASEMGPQGGDELNLVVAGANYGWPEASNGSHYGGGEIPDHTDGDGFEPPKAFWTPSISPGSLMIYTGDLFPAWKGNAFLGALSGEALVRVDLDGEAASPAENWPMGARIRAVAEAPDGAIWLVQDGSRGRLLELRPA